MRAKSSTSLPVRGAWIEILLRYTKSTNVHASLPVRGAWIEIASILALSANNVSLPVRGAWIEINLYSDLVALVKSLPVRGAWIEISRPYSAKFAGMRRSPCGERGLKSPAHAKELSESVVAPRAGSVD